MNLSEQELQQLLARNPALKIREMGTTKKKKLTAAGRRKSDDFDSEAERRYYQQHIYPLLLTGQIVKCEMHRTFELLPPVSYQGHKFKNRVYTPDFYLEYRNGFIEVVEVKGRQVKKLQRDYPLRRQLFLLHYCIPNNWTFKEVHDDEI